MASKKRILVRVAVNIAVKIGNNTPKEGEEATFSFGFGTPGGIRTPDPRFRRPMLYPLSYRRSIALGSL